MAKKNDPKWKRGYFLYGRKPRFISLTLVLLLHQMKLGSTNFVCCFMIQTELDHDVSGVIPD